MAGGDEADQFEIEPYVLGELVGLALAGGVSHGLLIGSVLEQTTRTVTDDEHTTVSTTRRTVVHGMTAMPWAVDTAARWKRRLWDAVGRPDLCAWRASLLQSGVELAAGDSSRQSGQECIVGAWTVRSGTPAHVSTRESALIRHMAILGTLAQAEENGQVTESDMLSSAWCSPDRSIPIVAAGLDTDDMSPGVAASAGEELAKLQLPLAWGGTGKAVAPGPLLITLGADGDSLLPTSVPAISDGNAGLSSTHRCWRRSWTCLFGGSTLRKALSMLQDQAPQLLAPTSPSATGSQADSKVTAVAGDVDDDTLAQDSGVASSSNPHPAATVSSSSPVAALVASPSAAADDAADRAGFSQRPDKEASTVQAATVATPADDSVLLIAGKRAERERLAGAWAEVLMEDLEPEPVPLQVVHPTIVMGETDIGASDTSDTAAPGFIGEAVAAAKVAVLAGLKALRDTEDEAASHLRDIARLEASGVPVSIV